MKSLTSKQSNLSGIFSGTLMTFHENSHQEKKTSRSEKRSKYLQMAKRTYLKTCWPINANSERPEAMDQQKRWERKWTSPKSAFKLQLWSAINPRTTSPYAQRFTRQPRHTKKEDQSAKRQVTYLWLQSKQRWWTPTLLFILQSKSLRKGRTLCTFHKKILIPWCKRSRR